MRYLSPEFLRTCKHIYFEASEVLYGCNTFFFVGVSQYDVDHFQDIFRRCPIARYHTTTKKLKTQKVWSKYILTMQKVRRWKTIIRTYTWGRWNLSPFCREICNAPLPPTSLEIIVVSEEGTGAILVPIYSIKALKRLRLAVELVQALRNMRNIGELRFANAKPTDCPRFYNHFEENITYREVDYVTKDSLYHPIPLLLQAELQALVTGNSTVEHMNALIFTEKRWAETGPIMKFHYMNLLGALNLSQKTIGSWISPMEICLNPYWPHNYDEFQDHLRHPVEVGLDKWNTAVDDSDAVTFKSEYRIILQYLERQYWRILQVSRDIHLFIRKHKRNYDLFDVNRERTLERLDLARISRQYNGRANGCVLLEAYADTFKREQTFAAIATIARMRAEFDGYYNSMPREIAIQEAIQLIQNFQDGCNYNA
ncbi:uncharacterized protein Bfra_001578 [Botrytis fragariae]|uniref:Uncharacterized protein n=1 Tax=Botrytis fragariae TaxID=1964551 RepID=A0A8H6B126_9HELO|nr:uncharacterized protein Bfra_001578 [Botrytis fragariae]KAF5877213.1 hypothetical protein Bfra_001578 [Botrytis fragariae]